jgi:putative polyketide hydroxylase
MSQQRTPVLIVGGALTGLSTAVFLAWHGVPCVLVERHPDLLIHPRLRGINQRTMELFRQVGMESAIKDACFVRGEGYEWVPVIANTLADEEYTRPDEPAEGLAEDLSPSPYGPIDQDRLEILLRERAEELGVEIRFATELTGFTQDETGVTATVVDRHDGMERTIRADYLAHDDAGTRWRTSMCRSTCTASARTSPARTTWTPAMGSARTAAVCQGGGRPKRGVDMTGR